MVGYFDEQAVISYTEYLTQVDPGNTPNIEAPDIAKTYYKLKSNATLRDVIIAVRKDEQGHSDVNHEMADNLKA